jgi:hypothetical protein
MILLLISSIRLSLQNSGLTKRYNSDGLGVIDAGIIISMPVEPVVLAGVSVDETPFIMYVSFGEYILANPPYRLKPFNSSKRSFVRMLSVCVRTKSVVHPTFFARRLRMLHPRQVLPNILEKRVSLFLAQE